MVGVPEAGTPTMIIGVPFIHTLTYKEKQGLLP
jgi:hypothetical protein